MSKINCPSCNTEFEQDAAPWLKQVEYCPKHDRVRLAGTLCEFCEMESDIIVHHGKPPEPAPEPDTVPVAAETPDAVPVAAETPDAVPVAPAKKSRK